MDIWEYFLQKETEFRSFSLTPANDRGYAGMFFADSENEDRRGRILGGLDLTHPARIEISEQTEIIDASYAHRLSYSYYLVVDGAEVWGYDRDPTHPIPEHRHSGPEHGDGEAWDRVTFGEVAQEAWDYVTEHGLAE